ncbi:hypothetical protein KKC62_01455 [Patescibacteria group bacterium]|nr:hypothetical protein [Patescibacteria group bacterium]MBU1952863.1 hypothetical protein [Patescibacteria group bacterium]
MEVTYFQYPWRGNIYALDVDESELRNGKPVKLPAGSLVTVTVPKGYFPEVEENAASKEGALTARVVISADDTFQREFKGNWKPLIELINIAAAVNTLFTIILTNEEFHRLKKGGLAKMEKKFSKRAFSLLYLYDSYVEEGKPSLELFRTGRCP